MWVPTNAVLVELHRPVQPVYMCVYVCACMYEDIYAHMHICECTVIHVVAADCY